MVGRLAGMTAATASSFSLVPVHAQGSHRAVFSIGRLVVFREKLFVSSCPEDGHASTCYW